MAKKSQAESLPPPAPTWSDVMSRGLREAAMIGLFFVSVYLLVALVSFAPQDAGWHQLGTARNIQNAGGPVGAWLASVLLTLFGYLAYLLPVFFSYRAWMVFRDKRAQPWHWPTISLRGIGLCITLLSAAGLAYLHIAANPADLPAIDSLGRNPAGGIVGMQLGQMAVAQFSPLGATLIFLALFLSGLTLFADISWIRLMDKVGAWTLRGLAWLQGLPARFNDWRQTRKAQRAERLAETKAKPKPERPKKKRVEPVLSDVPVVRDAVDQAPVERKSFNIELPAALSFSGKDKSEKKPKPPKVDKKRDQRQKSLFDNPVTGDLPSVALLDPVAPHEKKGFSTQVLEDMSRLLEVKLADFGIEAEVVNVMPGPVVTRFEIQPAPGIKVSRITNLAKDLARSLAVISVRVVEVIPGKTVVGIEIPNEDREIIRLSEILSSHEYDKQASALTLALGKDIAGKSVVADLAKMPHLLVAGTTGSGKSVGLNAMLLSMLFKATPEQLRLIMIDPKMLELAVYDGIPHLLTPVVTDMKEAANALRWSVGEMERRYRLMAAMGVRNLAGFNKKIKESIQKGEPLKDPLYQPTDDAPDAPDLHELPYIVVVIDEFADMMMIVGKKVEELIARIAQKARAAGIHLILATQRPSVDVITGLIKANVPSRIGFQVSSKIDSRTILDQGGAEQLLGHGDMLYLPPGTSLPLRVHGAFVDDDEVHRVCDDWRQRGEPDYLEDILDGGSSELSLLPGETSADANGDEDSDPLYDQAVAFVTESRRASISAVQRKLKIGYNRAARMIEMMEMAGVVTEMQSNGQREVIAPPPPK